MQLLSTTDMMKKISESWSFVSGAAFQFKESNHSYHMDDHENLMAVILPMYIDSKPLAESIAIGLILDEAEAIKVASHMFGLTPETLSLADIQDAKKETCNILGGSLIVDENSKLGLPREIPLTEFLELQKNATFSRLFVSEEPNEDLVNLMIFDVNNNSLGEFLS